MHPDAFWTIVCLAVIAYLFYGPWQSACTSYARQVIFEKRDAIFDLAALGELDFASTEYRTIRSSLEKSIRFAHELTLPRFLLYRWYLRNANLKQTSSDLMEAIEGIQSDGTRRRVVRLVAEAQIALILMMFAKSPLTVVIAVTFALLSHFRAGFKKRLAGWVRPFGEMAQMEAEYAPVKVSSRAYG